MDAAQHSSITHDRWRRDALYLFPLPSPTCPTARTHACGCPPPDQVSRPASMRAHTCSHTRSTSAAHAQAVSSLSHGAAPTCRPATDLPLPLLSCSVRSGPPVLAERAGYRTPSDLTRARVCVLCVTLWRHGARMSVRGMWALLERASTPPGDYAAMTYANIRRPLGGQNHSGATPISRTVSSDSRSWQ